MLDVRSDGNRVVVALAGYAISLRDLRPLLKIIGAGQLVSVRRTFAESGSPSGSWPPLSPVSLRWRKYEEGHKLLILSSRLLNSIKPVIQGSSVILGTAVKYAWVHQKGYSGPQKVGAYSYSRAVSTRDVFQKSVITNRIGRQQTVTRKTVGGVTFVNVKPFTRNVVIPPRPFLVFRPEDPGRIRQEAALFLSAKQKEAGL